MTAAGGAGADEKAFLETETGTRIPCLFNPETLEVSVGSSWEGATLPGRTAPQLRYGGGKPGRLRVQLTFDTTADASPVTDHTDKLIRLTQPDTELPGYDAEAANGRPAWVKFHWGTFHSFRAVVDDLQISYTYFGRSGEPLRAKVDVSMVQYEPEDDWPRQNPTSGTPKPARSHRVQPGETLDRVAAAHYGRPTAWRTIAEANGIRDPFAVPPGVVLDVPTIQE